MIQTPEQFIDAQKTALDSTMFTFNKAFTTAERVAELNMSTSRAMFDDFTASVRSMLTATTPEELVTMQIDSAQPFAEKSVSYCRSVQEIITQGMEEAVKPFEKQLGEAGKIFAAEIEKAAKSSPIGADAAVAAVKSTFAAANSTYDQVSKATRQAVDIAEANFNAATDAAVKAVGTGVPRAKAKKTA